MLQSMLSYYVSFLCVFMSPSFFHAPISLHPLLCGSTDQAAHGHFLSFALHLQMSLGYSHTFCFVS
jgi:hypothetical protein